MNAMVSEASQPLMIVLLSCMPPACLLHRTLIDSIFRYCLIPVGSKQAGTLMIEATFSNLVDCSAVVSLAPWVWGFLLAPVGQIPTQLLHGLLLLEK